MWGDHLLDTRLTHPSGDDLVEAGPGDRILEESGSRISRCLWRWLRLPFAWIRMELPHASPARTPVSTSNKTRQRSLKMGVSVGVAAPRARAARSRALGGCRHPPQCHQASPVGPAARAARPVRQLPAPLEALKYQRYLAYDQYLADGLPIGSGVIESACRHLVKDRLARTGARWRLRGAEAPLSAAPQGAAFQRRFRRVLEVPRGAGVRAYPPAALRRRTGAVAARAPGTDLT